MRRRIYIYITLLVLFAVLSITLVIGFYSRNVINNLIEENRHQILTVLDNNIEIYEQILFKISDDILEDYKTPFNRSINNIIQTGPFQITEEELKRIAERSGIDHLYIIDNNGKVVTTTLETDRELNLFELSPHLHKFLKNVYGRGIIFTQEPVASTQTGHFNNYLYYSPEGSDYIIEASIDIQNYVESTGDRYGYNMLRDYLLIKTFEENNLIEHIDVFSTSEYGSWSLAYPVQPVDVNFDLLMSIPPGGEHITREGDRVTILTSLFDESTDMFKDVTFAKIVLNLEVLSDYYRGLIIFFVLISISLFAAIFFAAKNLIDRYLISRVYSINEGIKQIESGEYNHKINIHGKDEISQIAESINSLAKTVKDRENEIRLEEGRFQIIFNNVSDAVFILKAETGKIVDVNKRVTDLFGYSLEELKNQNIGYVSEGTSPYSQEDAMTWLSEVKKGATPVFEWQARHKNGSCFWVEISMRATDIRGEGNILISARDISEKKKLGEESQRIAKLEALGVLAGGIAHDFNNLLGGIYGFIDIARTQSEDSEINESLSMAMNTINRARGLTRQLLTFAKGGVPVKETGSLIPLIEETVRFALSGSNVSAEFHIADNLKMSNFDKNQLGQVLENLTINAQQAMPHGGNISVSAENINVNDEKHPVLKQGEYIKITISDEGDGIPEEFLDRIFDPFFTTKSKGHGLGLATAYSIINLHGGCIDVNSRPGKGSSFYIYLPASVETVLSTENPFPGTHQGKGTILIMDDEDVIRETIGKMFKIFGYNIILTENGQEALDIFERDMKSGGTISGMIFDLTIPGGMGGADIIGKVRKLSPDIPVFVASGYAQDPVIANPSGYGFTGSISKPFKIEELAEMLEKYLK